MPNLTQRLMRPAARLGQAFWWTRAVTLGVRVAVLDERRVFLVRHTYRPGWYLPGGAVDRGETAEAAAIRELHEEGQLRCEVRPQLFGLYRNAALRGRDHVACYIVDRWSLDSAAPRHPGEIAESGFFPVDALPGDTTRATRARLAEILDGAPVAQDW